MWRLFPNSWIERAGVFRHRHIEAAEGLERHWLEWLEVGLRRVNPRIIEIQNSDSVQALRAMSGHGLLCLDEILRNDSFRHGVRLISASPPQKKNDCDELVTDAYLFVAACSPSGFVRERALDALANFPGPLAFAAGLIRSTDWVTQVRSAAIALVRSIAPQMSPEEIVRFLELAVRLKGRARVDENLWQTCIEHRLKASESQEALWAAAREPCNSSLLRRSAFEYLMLGDPGNLKQILSTAVAVPDIRVGMWALAQSKGLHRADERLRVLKSALVARHAAVRLNALRHYTTLNADDLDQTLRVALFDFARGIRALAAFELMRTRGENALPVWRAAVNHPQRRMSETAIMSLCEFGESEDLERIRFAGVPRNAMVRASILRGLWRIGSADLEAQLASALMDRSTRVIRQAAEIYRHGSVALDAVTLENALADVEDSRSRYLIALSDSLGKWEDLEFLLHHALSENRVHAECAANQIDRWILSANRRFTAPSADRFPRLIRLSREAQARHSQRNWRSLDSSLATFV